MEKVVIHRDVLTSCADFLHIGIDTEQFKFIVPRNSCTGTSSKSNEIRSIVSAAEYEAFFPILYIVESKKVKDRYVEVVVGERASDDAVEYKIEDLKENEFEIISFKDILSGVVNIVDKKVGE